MYADGFYNSMTDDKDGHIPSPLIMFTRTTSRDAVLEWQKNTTVHLKAPKSKLNADRPDRSKYFKYRNDRGKNASWCTTTGCKLLTSPGIADTYTFLMNTWNTPPVSYQHRVYTNTVATVKRQIQQAENTTSAMVIRLVAARVGNGIHLDHLTSEVALEDAEIGSTDPKILIDNNCTDYKLYFGIAGGSGDHDDEGDKSDKRNAIATARRRQRAATKLETFCLESNDVDGHEGEDGDNENVDDEEEASQANDGSTQNVED